MTDATKIKVNFGLDASMEVPLNGYGTVGDITSNAAIRSVLGFGDNVEAVVGGLVVASSFTLHGGETVDLRPKNSDKGS